ncbi:MAG: DUF4105 domain-containing protein [Gammaproteobacteria bacterium]|nr:DUF4105 domain-containing protein [Gammaproteobacteria bacterium]
MLGAAQILAGTLYFLAFATVPCIAANPAEPKAGVAFLLQQANARALATDPYWLALVHYKRMSTGDGPGYKSEIVSPEFFLSSHGSTDPHAELQATLAAFFEPPGENSDAHAQCRLIARYKWLRKTLDWSESRPPAVACPRYNAYTFNNQVDSLSLIYASGYLSNPASYYGHILLKFNARRATAASELLDQSLNFGAEIPRDETGMAYVLKGLFGGYEASFTHRRFYHFNHAYAENELRDLWEYELRLSEDEVNQIVLHSWELLGGKYDYYFLKENCAYRMAELLELVIDQPLLPDIPWAIPGTVFERIVVLRHDGKPLVRAVRRIPSRQSRFRERFLAMSPAEQRLVVDWVAGTLDFEGAAYASASATSKVNVVDMLLDYYEYRIVLDRSDAQLARVKHKLLVERARLPAQHSPDQSRSRSPDAAPPHEGPRPFMVRLGAIHNDRLGQGAELRIRPANYDLLALDRGRIPNSYLAMFDLRAVYLDQRLSIRSLDFVKIENLNVPRTPLPQDGSWAWKFGAGLEAYNLDCSQCTVFKVTGALGRAAPLRPGVIAFGFVDLFVQTEYETSETVGVVPNIGLIASPVSVWKTSLTVGRQLFLNGPRSETRVVRWENRLGNKRDWDFRICYEEHVAREFLAAMSMYW